MTTCVFDIAASGHRRSHKFLKNIITETMGDGGNLGHYITGPDPAHIQHLQQQHEQYLQEPQMQLMTPGEKGRQVSAVAAEELIPINDLRGCWCCHGKGNWCDDEALSATNCAFGAGCIWRTAIAGDSSKHPVIPDQLNERGVACCDLCPIPCNIATGRTRVPGTNSFYSNDHPGDIIVFHNKRYAETLDNLPDGKSSGKFKTKKCC